MYDDTQKGLRLRRNCKHYITPAPFVNPFIIHVGGGTWNEQYGFWCKWRAGRGLGQKRGLENA